MLIQTLEKMQLSRLSARKFFVLLYALTCTSSQAVSESRSVSVESANYYLDGGTIELYGRSSNGIFFYIYTNRHKIQPRELVETILVEGKIVSNSSRRVLDVFRELDEWVKISIGAGSFQSYLVEKMRGGDVLDYDTQKLLVVGGFFEGICNSTIFVGDFAQMQKSPFCSYYENDLKKLPPIK